MENTASAMSEESIVTPTPTNHSLVLATESCSLDCEQKTKTGRPNNWTASRTRKLARLYLYSDLPPTDIPEALREDNWVPGFVETPYYVLMTLTKEFPEKIQQQRQSMRS